MSIVAGTLLLGDWDADAAGNYYDDAHFNDPVTRPWYGGQPGFIWSQSGNRNINFNPQAGYLPRLIVTPPVCPIQNNPVTGDPMPTYLLGTVDSTPGDDFAGKLLILPDYSADDFRCEHDYNVDFRDLSITGHASKYTNSGLLAAEYDNGSYDPDGSYPSSVTLIRYGEPAAETLGQMAGAVLKHWRVTNSNLHGSLQWSISDTASPSTSGAIGTYKAEAISGAVTRTTQRQRLQKTTGGYAYVTISTSVSTVPGTISGTIHYSVSSADGTNSMFSEGGDFSFSVVSGAAAIPISGYVHFRKAPFDGIYTDWNVKPGRDIGGIYGENAYALTVSGTTASNFIKSSPSGYVPLTLVAGAYRGGTLNGFTVADNTETSITVESGDLDPDLDGQCEMVLRSASVVSTSGTLTGGTGAIVEDTTWNWAEDIYQGGTITVTGKGSRTVVSNTAHTITVDSDFSGSLTGLSYTVTPKSYDIQTGVALDFTSDIIWPS